MPSIDEYEELVKKIDFEEVRIWGENMDRYFPNAEAMIKWIDQPSIVPFLKYLDEKDKQAFRNVVVKKMIEITRQSDDRCFETFRRINLSAIK